MNFHLAHLGEVILLFQDEALIKFHPALSRCWNKIGERREVQTFDNHGKSTIFGSVNPFSGELIHTYGNTINQVFFLEHLDEIKQKYFGKTIIIVLDNCRSHFTKKVQKFLEVNKNFFLLFLPPYSPDFNVIERLWQVLRKAVTNNFLFQSLEEVKTASTKFLQFLSSDVVRKICAI